MSTLAPKAEGQGSRGPPRSRVTYPCDAEGLREVTRKAISTACYCFRIEEVTLPGLGAGRPFLFPGLFSSAWSYGTRVFQNHAWLMPRPPSTDHEQSAAHLPGIPINVPAFSSVAQRVRVRKGVSAWVCCPVRFSRALTC